MSINWQIERQINRHAGVLMDKTEFNLINSNATIYLLVYLLFMLDRIPGAGFI